MLKLSPYPLDMDMTLTREILDADGIPYHKTAGHQPSRIAHYALAHWNAYLATNQEGHRSAFLLQARWLTQSALLIQTSAAGWPIPLPSASPHPPSSHLSPFCLSATIQGSALSVLLRAYLLTQDQEYLHLAHLVFATFELDILDGGIMAPIAEQGLWFEEYALYPAAHSLSGMLIALLALHEFAHLIPTRETSAISLFERAFATFYTLLPEFETGYCLRNNLLQRLLITPEQFALNITLLNALAYLTGDDRAYRVTKRWLFRTPFSMSDKNRVGAAWSAYPMLAFEPAHGAETCPPSAAFSRTLFRDILYKMHYGLCRDGMVSKRPTDPTTMQSRPANPTTMQLLQGRLARGPINRALYGLARRPINRAFYLCINFWQRSQHIALTTLRLIFFPRRIAREAGLRVCVPITAFPLAGGMRTILDKIEKSMQLPGMPWHMTYMTQHIGPQDGSYHIERFGTRLSSPRQFPLVWAYVLLGGLSLFQALFRGASYDLLLPQDGLFTAAFTAILGRLAGIRVVCIDHGNLAALSSKLYRQERLQSLCSRRDLSACLRRRLEPWLFSAYWPSLHLLARISARFVDYYAIPGVVGDGIEEICRELGIPLSRLVRFVNTVDVGTDVYPCPCTTLPDCTTGICRDGMVPINQQTQPQSNPVQRTLPPCTGTTGICRDGMVPINQQTQPQSNPVHPTLPPCTALQRTDMRVRRGIAADAIVITTICRLSPEKGVEIALQALDHALSQLSPALRTRVRFIIAGDGVLRSSLEKEIMQRGLGSICTLWGEISPDEARVLHVLSDIYIYSGTRGGGYSLAILEAMAAASAVLASDVPLANVRMLEDERGLLVSAGDVVQTAQALVRLLEHEELRLQLGKNAREHVSRYNTEQEFRRVWLRATCWSDLAAFINGPFVEGKGRQADESITGF